MATLVSGNRSDLKKTFKKMLEQVSQNDLGEIGISIDIFEGLCFRYCLAKNKDFKVFHEKASGIRHSLTHFTNPKWRTQRLYQQLQEIHELFAKGKVGMSLQSQLRMISEDLLYDLSQIFESVDDFDPTTIYDDFNAITELGDQIKQYGYSTYQLYRQLVRNIGVCKPHIPPKISGAGRPRPQDIKQLKQSVGPIFSVLDDLIVTFDQPPAPKEKTKDKKKKEKAEFELDLDEVKREARTQEAIRYIFKEGWTVKSTAMHLNMTIPELLNLLDIDFGEDEEEEKKKKTSGDNDKVSDEKERDLGVEENNNNNKSD